MKKTIKYDNDHIFTSKEVLDGDESLFNRWKESSDHVKYKLTEDEWGWVDFIRGKYCIADYINRNTTVMKDGRRVTEFYFGDMSRALDDDCKGAGKAVMLSDDAALQRIFFDCYDESASDEEEESPYSDGDVSLFDAELRDSEENGTDQTGNPGK